jgi:hypothetical protein
MKRLSLILLLAVTLRAALPQNTAWEVRPTVGSDTTAGVCFVTGSSGTDYSQQNAAQYSGTDLVLGAGGTTATSVSHSFVPADIGNCIHITAGTGFTPGYYEITAVGVGVFGQATFDRSAGSAASIGGTYYVGGAGATVSNANTNAQPGNTVWVKATGTYTVTSAMTVSMNSNVSPFVPLSFIGYSSTRGDNGQFTWTTSTNSIDLVTFSVAHNVAFENILFSTTAGTPGYGLHGAAVADSSTFLVLNCKFSGFNIGIYGDFNVNSAIEGLSFVNSRITASVSHGLLNSSSTYIFGSQLDNNGGDGAVWQAASISDSSSWVVENSIFYHNTLNGLIEPGFGGGEPILIINHSDFSTNGQSGILTSSTLTPIVQISNSIMDANVGFGLGSGTNVTFMPWQLYNNAYYNNGSGPVQNINAGIGTITLSASPYVSVGTNFALNNTSGGGAALVGTGFPGVLPNGGGTGYANVGALDPMAGSSSGGAHGYPIVQ